MGLLLLALAVVIGIRRSRDASNHSMSPSFRPSLPSTMHPSLLPGCDMSEAELAKMAAQVASRAVEAILWARDSDRSPAEGNSRPRSGKPEDGPIRLRRNKIFAAIARMNQRVEVFKEFDAVRGRFLQEFGAQTTRPLDVINQTRSLVAAHTEALIQLDIAVGGDPRKELAKRHALEATSGLWIPNSGIDSIKQKLDEALIPIRALAKSLK
ncbi:MAG: hypothetical protein GY854_30790 [Deltaproteobacteria bacterium]|nr:hypothetical protein [Deltaproteobacteria bacterium]